MKTVIAILLALGIPSTVVAEYLDWCNPGVMPTARWTARLPGQDFECDVWMMSTGNEGGVTETNCEGLDVTGVWKIYEDQQDPTNPSLQGAQCRLMITIRAKSYSPRMEDAGIRWAMGVRDYPFDPYELGSSVHDICYALGPLKHTGPDLIFATTNAQTHNNGTDPLMESALCEAREAGTAYLVGSFGVNIVCADRHNTGNPPALLPASVCWGEEQGQDPGMPGMPGQTVIDGDYEVFIQALIPEPDGSGSVWEIESNGGSTVWIDGERQNDVGGQARPYSSRLLPR